jgi:hypothetical protein
VVRDRENCEKKVNIKVVIEVMTRSQLWKVMDGGRSLRVSVQMLLTTFVHVFYPSFLHDSTILSRLLWKNFQTSLLKEQFNVNTILDGKWWPSKIYFFGERTPIRNSLFFRENESTQQH